MQPIAVEPPKSLVPVISINGEIEGRVEAEGTYRVLIVESNRPLARLISRELMGESFAVDVLHDQNAAIGQLDMSFYNLLILDLNLADTISFQLLQQAPARWPQTRILALSSQGGTEALVSALDQGADDYLPKPFSLLEMMARIRAIRRRSDSSVSIAAPKVDGVILHKDKCQAVRDGRAIDLTPREFALLEYLVQNPGKTLSRSQLSQDVWNMEFDPNTNIVDVYIKYLRDKIDQNESVKLIRTVRGLGYVFMSST